MSQPDAASAPTYSFAGVQLKPWRRLLLRDGQPLSMGSRAFDVLVALVQRSPELVTKDSLMNAAWPGLVVEEANLHVQVSSLRRLLGPGVIGTAPGLGYHLTAPVVMQSDPAFEPDPGGQLLGRGEDLERLRTAVARHRLITIVGPAGVGKSALARAFVSAHPTAVWVDLAAIARPEHMATAVANAAKVSLGGGADPLEALVRALQARHGLLVLDNIEHLVEHVAAASRALLRGAPHLRLLATGQVSLQTLPEQVLQLLPLPVPRPQDNLEQARASPALALLERQAHARDARFELTPAMLPKATALLQALDGLPLAIEMAAARVPALGLDLGGGQLVERLRRMQHIDSSVPARHRTLWAALTWSHDLLPADQQTMLGLLASFATTFGQAQATAAAGAAGFAADAALAALAGLVDRSLVQATSAEPQRYRMLESMRQFAAERLLAEGRVEAAERCHIEAMVALAHAVETGHLREPESDWLAGSQPDYDNLQLAFDRAISRRDMASAAALGLALLRIDHTNDVTPPRQRRGQALHAGLADADPLAQARIWTCLSLWSIVLVPGLSFPEAAHRGLAAWRLVGDTHGLHEALCLQASALARTARLHEARLALQEARALEAADWPPRSLAFGLGAQYDVALYAGDFAAALDAAQAESALLHHAGIARLAALVRAKIPDLLLLSGRAEEAVTNGRKVVAALRARQLPAFLGHALSNLCGAMLVLGEAQGLREVPALAAEAWQLVFVHGRKHALYGVMALLAARQGQAELAAKLLGAADGWYRGQCVQRSPASALLEGITMHILRGALGVQRCDALRASAMSLPGAEVPGLVYQVLGDALGPASGPAPTSSGMAA